jgi:hypothetical protein
MNLTPLGIGCVPADGASVEEASRRAPDRRNPAWRDPGGPEAEW